MKPLITARNITTLITVSALLLTQISTAFAQNLKYFRPDEENKAIRINTLFKDHAGYLYLGTTAGLSKFDGLAFSPVHFNNKDYSDTVTALFEDKDQKLWVGFQSGRIAHMINNKLVYYNPEEGTPRVRITGFLQDKENSIWFSTNGEGIYQIKNGHIYLLGEENGLSDTHINSITLTDEGNILAATDQGINCISKKNGKSHITVINPRKGLPDYIVTKIIPAGKNRYWVGMQDHGFCLYDHGSGQITNPQIKSTWNHGEITALLYAQEKLWIATPDSLFIYDDSSHDLTFLPGISSQRKINGLLEDNEGNIWITAREEGLIRSSGIKVTQIDFPPGVEFEHIHAILSDSRGNLWITNKKNELIRYDRGNGGISFERIPLPGINESVDITSLYQDIFGNIWIGTMGKGILVLDPQTRQHKSFTEYAPYTNASVLSINGKDNAIFISGLQGSLKITLANNNSNIHNPYSYTLFESKKTGTDYVYNIYEDKKGRIWFATDGRGLSVFENGRYTNYKDETKIKDDRIYSITEDKKGNIWFSTRSAGIYEFDGQRFTNFGIAEGLSDVNISSVKTDGNGNIVIIHKKGLDILNPSTHTISYLNSNQGINLLNTEDLGGCNSRCEGKCYVCSQSGVIIYSPVKSISERPKTLIENVQLFLKNLDVDASNRFRYDENNLTFNFTGLYYTDPERVTYQYKLDGLDTSWIFTKDHSKTFPRLEPGSYTFKVRSSLNMNFENASEASYSFVIEKAFYKQWWFIAGLVFLLLAILYWYIRNREKHLKNIERLRQEKARFQFDVLRNQVNPHFLFNSFNTLISTIEEDPGIAVQYVEQLSDFFRQIVNYRDKDVITLKEEIELLQTYFFLQQKRHGANLQLNVHVTEEQKLRNFIPPLTLQLLTENAIKHNAITKEIPLRISIDIKGDTLIVTNNINPRSSKQEGAGMGLQNIISRYNLLTSKHVELENNNRQFVISLPLIAKSND